MSSTFLDFGRDEVDKIIREVGNTWWEAARQAVPPLLEAAIVTAARVQKIEVGYLRWALLNDRRSWEPISRSEMLEVAVRLFLVSVGRSHDDVRFEIPPLEDETKVNKALGALVKWADTTFLNLAIDILLASADGAAKRVQRAAQDISGELISEKQAKLVILVELPLRVKDHPYWFRDPASLRHLMGRITRKG